MSRNQKVLAFVMAGGKGSRLHPLTAERCKPAMHLHMCNQLTVERDARIERCIVTDSSIVMVPCKFFPPRMACVKSLHSAQVPGIERLLGEAGIKAAA